MILLFLFRHLIGLKALLRAPFNVFLMRIYPFETGEEELAQLRLRPLLVLFEKLLAPSSFLSERGFNYNSFFLKAHVPPPPSLL